MSVLIACGWRGGHLEMSADTTLIIRRLMKLNGPTAARDDGDAARASCTRPYDIAAKSFGCTTTECMRPPSYAHFILMRMRGVAIIGFHYFDAARLRPWAIRRRRSINDLKCTLPVNGRMIHALHL